jgi:hypothetical protein
MRLRPLTEAECYARCYGGRTEETVNLLRPDADERPTVREQHEAFEMPEAIDTREAA